MLVRPSLREYRTWSIDSRRWLPYRPRQGDIVIATPPKCGTTWMQQIVSSLVFQDSKPRALPDVSPWIEARFRGGNAADVHARIDLQEHRRFLKSHLPIDGLPLYDEVRYIHVVRDGRDAVMSMHNHYSSLSEAQLQNFDRIGQEDPLIGRPYPRPSKDVAEFFRQWISTPIIPGQSDGIPAPSFFDLVAGYWSVRERPNVLLVHYNDLKRDLDAEMRRITAFLEIAVDEAKWPLLVGAADFAAMRANGGALMPQMKTMLTGGPERFFHKATNGRWRDALSDSDLALYDAKVKATLSPSLANWLEHGRFSAGEPRTATD